MKSVASVADKARIRDNRSILFSLVIQIVVPTIANILLFMDLGLSKVLPTAVMNAYVNSFLFDVFNWLYVNYTSYWGFCTPAIIILATMKPYRDVWSSWIFTTAKRVHRLLTSASSTVVHPFVA